MLNGNYKYGNILLIVFNFIILFEVLIFKCINILYNNIRLSWVEVMG